MGQFVFVLEIGQERRSNSVGGNPERLRIGQRGPVIERRSQAFQMIRKKQVVVAAHGDVSAGRLLERRIAVRVSVVGRFGKIEESHTRIAEALDDFAGSLRRAVTNDE